MKRYAYKTVEDKVKIIHASRDAEQLAESIDPGCTFLGEVTEDSMPSRKFRGSWKEDSGSFSIDLTAAREEKMTEIRAKRDELLAESDAMWVEVASKDEAQADIQAYKQDLRDMTTTEQAAVDAISDVDELEAHEATYPTKP